LSTRLLPDGARLVPADFNPHKRRDAAVRRLLAHCRSSSPGRLFLLRRSPLGCGQPHHAPGQRTCTHRRRYTRHQYMAGPARGACLTGRSRRRTPSANARSCVLSGCSERTDERALGLLPEEPGWGECRHDMSWRTRIVLLRGSQTAQRLLAGLHEEASRTVGFPRSSRQQRMGQEQAKPRRSCPPCWVTSNRLACRCCRSKRRWRPSATASMRSTNLTGGSRNEPRGSSAGNRVLRIPFILARRRQMPLT
jgi:hypothetical protein